MRGKAASILGSAVFLVLAPGVLAGWLPWRITRWHEQSHMAAGWRLAGVLLVMLGVPVLLDSFARFALLGRGTPAPVAPPDRLIVSGLYRHVRNPMYVSVMSVILGQALLFGSRTLVAYAAIVWLACHLFVLLYEEPTLRRQFGAEYDRYLTHVGRWWPRLRPYRDEEAGR